MWQLKKLGKICLLFGRALLCPLKNPCFSQGLIKKGNWRDHLFYISVTSKFDGNWFTDNLKGQIVECNFFDLLDWKELQFLIRKLLYHWKNWSVISAAPCDVSDLQQKLNFAYHCNHSWTWCSHTSKYCC